jgi:hypothetical protein
VLAWDSPDVGAACTVAVGSIGHAMMIVIASIDNAGNSIAATTHGRTPPFLLL